MLHALALVERLPATQLLQAPLGRSLKEQISWVHQHAQPDNPYTKRSTLVFDRTALVASPLVAEASSAPFPLPLPLPLSAPFPLPGPLLWIGLLQASLSLDLWSWPCHCLSWQEKGAGVALASAAFASAFCSCLFSDSLTPSGTI